MIPLVLVHGFMGGGAQWDGCLDDLDQRDVITIDLPGFGANADMAPMDRIGDFADWVICYLKAEGIRRYHLLGHSMGGMIAQEIALTDAAAVKKLILYATGAEGILPGRFETIDESKKRAKQEGAIATARRIAATWFLEKEHALGYAHCAAIAQKSSLGALQGGLTAMESWTGIHNLEKIPHQTLVLWGDRDRTYPWPQIERLWLAIAHSNLAVIPHCAHAVHAENPTLFQAMIKGFLQEGAEPSG